MAKADWVEPVVEWLMKPLRYVYRGEFTLFEFAAMLVGFAILIWLVLLRSALLKQTDPDSERLVRYSFGGCLLLTTVWIVAMTLYMAGPDP